MIYKCPICKTESSFKGICFDCNYKHSLYRGVVVNKDNWLIKRLSINEIEDAKLYKSIYEKVKTHFEKLESKRKYTQGDVIKTFDELLDQKLVYMSIGLGTKITTISFVISMQLNTVNHYLAAGNFRKAIRKED